MVLVEVGMMRKKISSKCSDVMSKGEIRQGTRQKQNMNDVLGLIIKRLLCTMMPVLVLTKNEREFQNCMERLTAAFTSLSGSCQEPEPNIIAGVLRYMVSVMTTAKKGRPSIRPELLPQVVETWG